MRSKILGAVCAAAVALVVFVPAADAIVVNTPGGPVSYLPLSEASAPSAGLSPTASTVPTGEPPLLYHGGPVMHSQTAYAIFWAPSGFSFPSGYQTGIENFLEHVAADSGKSTNVYSVSAQYTDGAGHATYLDSYGGSFTDTTAYPTSGTCPPYSGFHGETYTACITDEKLEAEVLADITANSASGWPHGLGAEYYLVLPPHAGSCFDATHGACFDTEHGFCAYHSFTEANTSIYANISYSPGDPSGCGVGEYPNGHANGNVDDTLSSLSHEANESITDPLLNAWFDEEGLENGDECRNSSDDFGESLGGSAGTLFNQAIDSAHYYLQQEWSNDIEDCAQRVEPATPKIADPGAVAPGQSVLFNGSSSVPGSGGIASYHWDFGDGHGASGATASHAFAGPGVFTVTLTLEDDGEFTYSTSREVTVATSSGGGGGGGSSDGSGGSSSAGGTGGESGSGPTVKPVKCRRGFKKTKRHGKAVCVKVKKHHRKHHQRGRPASG